MPAQVRERQPWHVRLRLTPLAGWITLGEAAEDLGISRQAVHRLVERGTLKARTIGRRPIIVVREKDVQKLPISPQRSRELDKKLGDVPSGELRRIAHLRQPSAELDDELPEG